MYISWMVFSFDAFTWLGQQQPDLFRISESRRNGGVIDRTENSVSIVSDIQDWAFRLYPTGIGSIEWLTYLTRLHDVHDSPK